ncbi:MAG: DASS family sodium-coupled anion symporter [Hahellaceae bacterium]|nr:DASS family sodium-coupled anion symporter [Hahellaceae bacterium]
MKKLWVLLSLVACWGIIQQTAATTEAQTGLMILTIAALLWMTEAIHLSVTALLIPVLAVLLQVLSVKEALANFAHPIIFLFLGGFALASALHKQGLDKYIALQVLKIARGQTGIACILLFATTALLSMWISNTATTAMMLPIALGMLGGISYESRPRIFWFLLLGISYSASIGGIATLVGSPPNAIAASALKYSFSDWLAVGLPITIVLLPVLWLVLYLVFQPQLKGLSPPEQDLDFVWNTPRLLVLAIFALTATLWIGGEPIGKALGIQKDFDTVVALFAILLLHLSGCVGWKDIEKTTDWGVLLLFGGGLTLSAILKTSGANAWLATQLIQWVDGVGLVALLFTLVLFVIFLTEVSSNTALTALLVPTFISMAGLLGISQELVAITIALAASCAFMLPVATPPNAIVFGSGFIPQKQMMKVGLILNLISAVLITLLVWLLIA